MSASLGFKKSLSVWYVGIKPIYLKNKTEKMMLRAKEMIMMI